MFYYYSHLFQLNASWFYNSHWEKPARVSHHSKTRWLQSSGGAGRGGGRGGGGRGWISANLTGTWRFKMNSFQWKETGSSELLKRREILIKRNDNVLISLVTDNSKLLWDRYRTAAAANWRRRCYFCVYQLLKCFWSALTSHKPLIRSNTLPQAGRLVGDEWR